MIAKVMAVSLNYELSDSDDGETDLDGTVTATSADESADPAFWRLDIETGLSKISITAIYCY